MSLYNHFVYNAVCLTLKSYCGVVSLSCLCKMKIHDVH